MKEEKEAIKDPVVRRDGDEWDFLWADENVRVSVQGLRESSEGLHAEIEVRYVVAHANGKTNGNGGLIHGPVRANVLSTQARSSLAKHLVSRMGAVDWSTIVEYVCARTAREYRQGEPFVNLASLPMPATERYLIDRVLPIGQTSIVYARGGSMKSLVALTIAVAVSTRHAFPGLRPSQKVSVLYLDWESTPDEQRERIEWLAKGADLPTPAITYRRQYRALADDAARLRAHISRHNIGLVIIDSLAAACGGEPASAEVALRTMNALNSFDATRLAIAHVTKAAGDQKEGQATPFGSIFFREMARSTWELHKSDAMSDDDEICLGLFHRKVNRGKEQPPFGLKYHFRPNQITVHEHDVAADTELAAYAPLQVRVRSLLRRGAKTVKELAETLDAKEPTVKSALRRMPDAAPLGDSTGGRGRSNLWGLIDPATLRRN